LEEPDVPADAEEFKWPLIEKMTSFSSETNEAVVVALQTCSLLQKAVSNGQQITSNSRCRRLYPPLSL
jgi:hypothetical protein